MDIKFLLIMLPLFFLAGVLGRYLLHTALTAEPKTKKNIIKIKKDCFEIVQNQEPGERHTPDENTHSIISQVVKKRWWALTIFKWTDVSGDPLTTIHLIAPPVCVAVIFILALKHLTAALSSDPTPQKFLFDWGEKAYALFEPYRIPFLTAIIILCFVWVLWTLFYKRLRLIKDVHNRNYVYEVTLEEHPSSVDATLEVSENHRLEGCVRFDLFFNEKGWFYHRAVVKLTIASNTAPAKV